MNELEQLKRDVEELKAWKLSKETQQLSYPVDDASKNSLGALVDRGTGSAGAQVEINLTGNPQDINVPANPSGTLVVTGADGTQYELLLK